MYNTGNPIPSAALEDMADNAQVFDNFVNSSSTTTPNRNGASVKTRAGFEADHDSQMQAFESDFDGRLAGMAFTRVGSFTSGATLADMRQVLVWEVSQGGDGHEYGWTGSFLPSGKVVIAGSSPETTGGIGAGAWVDRTDVTLRSELTYSALSTLDSGRFVLRDFISVSDFDDVALSDTEIVQAALSYAQGKSYPVTVVFTKTRTITGQVNCTKDDISIVGFGGAKLIFDGGTIRFGNHTIDRNGYFITTAPVNKNLSISGLILTSSVVDTNSKFISVVGYDNINVHSNEFSNIKYEGMYFGCGNTNIKVTGNHFDSTGSTVESKGLTILHFSPDYADGMPVSLQSFLQVEATPLTYTSGVTVSGNTFVGTRCQLSNVRNGSISGNTFKSIVSRGVNCSPHIYDIAISGNVFDISSTASTAINVAHMAKNVNITNNIVTGDATGGARCINAYYQASVNIKGNKFNCGTINTITCSSNSKAEITGNTFQSKNLTGIDVYITSKDPYASDNTVGSSVSGVTTNTFAVIKDNVFLSPKAKPIYIKGEQAASNNNPIPISGSFIGKNVVYDFSSARASYGDAVVRIDSIGGGVSDISLMLQKLMRTSTSVTEISPTWGYFSSISSGGSISFREVEENSAEFLVTFSSGSVTATRISGPQEITLSPSISSNLVGLAARCAASIASVSLDFTRTNSLEAGSASIVTYPYSTPYFKVMDYSGVQIALSTANGSMYCKVRYNSLG